MNTECDHRYPLSPPWAQRVSTSTLKWTQVFANTLALSQE